MVSSYILLCACTKISVKTSMKKKEERSIQSKMLAQTLMETLAQKSSMLILKGMK